MLTIPAAQLGYVSAVTALAMAATSGLSGLLIGLPVFQASPARFTWVMRALNIGLILVGVVLAQLTQGTFNIHNWLAYVSYAAQGFTGAQLLYSATTARIKGERDAAQAQLSAAVLPWPAPVTDPNPGGLNSPVTFQPAGAAHDQH